MSIILDGRTVEVPNVTTVSYVENPTSVPPATDFYDRKRAWVQAIVLHTVHGSRGALKPGRRDSRRDEVYAQYQANSDRHVSWDATVDTDGSVAWSNDPLQRITWHATAWNTRSLGIELVQDHDGSVYEDQIAALVALLDVLTRELGIQRQIPWRQGKPIANVIPRADELAADRGRTLVGVFGHRNNTRNRGPGDPGDWPFLALARAGYEGFDFSNSEDLGIWRSRQEAAGLQRDDVDGIPGPMTRAAIESKLGRKRGLWVSRPGD